MATRSLLIPAAALALNAASAVQCHAAAVDYFLKLDGIEGESRDQQHKGEIELVGFSWGVEAVTSGGGGGAGAGAGKVAPITTLNFTKQIDKTTSTLFLKCATGQHIKSGIITVRATDAEHKATVDLLTIKLDNIAIGAIQENGGAGSAPMDSVSLNFAKVTIDQSSSDNPVDPTGGGTTTGGTTTGGTTTGGTTTGGTTTGGTTGGSAGKGSWDVHKTVSG